MRQDMPIFSADDQTYWCNMQKAFKRLEYLTEVYGGEEIAAKQNRGKAGKPDQPLP